MELTCASCKGNEFEMTLYELKVMGRSVVYSAIKCKGCGMSYPLAELGKNANMNQIASMLKS